MESFEFPGVWWIPADPHKTKFYGPLAFDPKNGGKLSLTYDKSHEHHEAIGSFARLCIPLVHGRMDGRKVTLIQCNNTRPGWQSRNKSGGGFTQTSTVWTDTVILGAHFNSLREIQFNSIVVSYTHMESWLGYRRWTRNDKGEPILQPFHQILVPIKTDVNILFRGVNYEEVGNPQSPYPRVLVAQIISDGKLPLYGRRDDDEAFFPYIDRYLRDFMNLVTGEPNYPFNIATVSPFNDKQLVRFYYRLSGYDQDAHRQVEVSFTVAHQDIESRFPLLLKTWIEKSKSLRSACDLYFKRYYLSNIDVQTQFLFLVQAVEAYHRGLHKDVYIEPVDYEPLREILDLVISFQVRVDFVQSWSDRVYDADTVESLMRKLNSTIEHGNEYSLRKRLNVIRRDVLMGNEAILKKILDDPSEFVHRVTETRHYLTHRLPEPNEYVLKRSEYPDFVRKLRKLIRLCFLVEMGLQPEDIEFISQYYPTSAP